MSSGFGNGAPPPPDAKLHTTATTPALSTNARPPRRHGKAGVSGNWAKTSAVGADDQRLPHRRLWPRNSPQPQKGYSRSSVRLPPEHVIREPLQSILWDGGQSQGPKHPSTMPTAQSPDLLHTMTSRNLVLCDHTVVYSLCMSSFTPAPSRPPAPPSPLPSQPSVGSSVKGAGIGHRNPDSRTLQPCRVTQGQGGS